MTFKHKLSRRLALLKDRGALIATAVLAAAVVVACEEPLQITDSSTGTVSRIVVSPKALTLRQNQTTDFTAVGLTSTGDPAPVAVSWSVTSGTITDTSTSNGKHYGRYKAGSDTGKVKVVAKGNPGGPSDTAIVSVTLAPVASVTVSPASASAQVGQTVQLSATTTDSAGNVLSGRAVTWASSSPLVATVSSSSLVNAVAVGAATITATSEGQSGSSALTVTQAPVAPVASVAVSPAMATILVGATVQLSATPKDANGNALTGRVVTWASSNAAAASVNGSGLVTGVAPGSATITATSEGQSGTSAITVSNVPVASVAVSPASAGILVGQTVQLAATPKDANGNALIGRVVTWASSNAAVAGVNGSGLVTGVAAGSATITATSEGQNGSAVITITQVPVAAVAVSPASASIQVGQTMQLIATPKDATGNPLSGRTMTWSSSNTSVATVSSSGLVTGKVASSATITATSEGQSGTAAVTVSDIPVASVVVSPASASVAVGATQQLSAVVKDANGNVLSGRSVSWASSAPGVATVSSSGLVAGVGAGAATITASSEGQTGSAAITVTPPSCFTSAGAWQNIVLPVQAGSFEARFDATPGSANMDGVVGLSNGFAADYTNLAAIVRFSLTGTIDARNGGAYAAAAVVPYSAGTTYHFHLNVDIPSRTYDIYVTPAGASEQLLGRGFSFRTEQAAVSVLNNLGVHTTAGSETVCNVALAAWTPPPPAPVASVTVSPAAASVTVGATTLLTASPKDSNGTPLTGRTVTWVSSNTAVATVSASGLVTGVAAGSATITATSEGKNGTSVISVTNAPVATVTVTPAVASILVGATLQLTATPKDSLGNPLSGRVVTWSSNALSVASVTGTGLVTGVAVGFATITATSEGVSGSAAITVTVLSTGGNYYVAPSGSDANPCSAAAPCFTMQRVSQLLAPGDVAHFAAGNYSWGVQNVSVSGTASARITYISDVKWGAKITGGCPALENNGDYVDFVNFDVTGSCATGIMVNGNYNGVIGNHVHNLPGNNGGYGGILVDCCKYTSKGDRIIGNVVHDIATSLGQSNTVHGIYVANAATIVQNNIVYRAAGWGLQLWHCPTNDTLSNNTVFNNFNGGIVIGGNSECPFASTNSNSVINNNIVYNNGTASNANGYGIEEYASGGIVNAQYANNLVYGNSPGNWNLMVTGGQGTNTVTAAPLFINYNPTGWGDYHEAVGSPSIDAGKSLAALPYDYDGVPRPYGASYDIGAYEWH